MRVTTNQDHRILAILVASLVLLCAFLAVVTPTGGGQGSAEQTPHDSPREQPLEEAESAPPPRVGLWTAPPPTNEAETPVAPPEDPDPGAFAEILADYGEIGFDQYRANLAGIGARFFIVRKPAFRVVAEVNPSDLTFRGIAPMEGLSPRSRDISAERRLQGLLASASAKFGEGDYGVVALLPMPVERRLMRDLDAIGRDVESGVDSFRCEYRFDRNGFALHVLEMRAKNGATVAAGRSIPLGIGY